MNSANEKCPDALLPDGPICPRCGGNRAPSGVDGGSWVHFTRPASLGEGSWAKLNLKAHTTPEKEVIAFVSNGEKEPKPPTISYAATLNEMHAALSELEAARAKLNAATAKIKTYASASEAPARMLARGYNYALDDVAERVRALSKRQPLKMERLMALDEVMTEIDRLNIKR